MPSSSRLDMGQWFMHPRSSPAAAGKQRSSRRREDLGVAPDPEALDEVERLVQAEPALREVLRADETITPAMEASMTDAELEQFCSGD